MTPPRAPEIPGVELHDVIGTGGSGVVYQGRQIAFDRPVAVKVVPTGSTDAAARRRWEREVAAIGRLTNHPNVVPVFDAGTTEDGTSYMVMPLVPGGSMGDRLRRDGALEPDEVATMGVKLAGALVASHAAGVLHRDVKPDNVLCSSHGEVQLTDFGIARLQDHTATLSGSLQATVSYAAPEVLAGGEATERTDVYGLGATLYAFLTGGAPHPTVPGEHLAAAVHRALEEDPPPLVQAGVPAGLAAVVERAISRDPAQRQGDAAQLRHELERAAEDLGAVGADDLESTQVLAAAGAAAAADPRRVDDTRVDAVPVAPAAARPAPAPTAPPDESQGNRTLWLGVLAVVVLAAGLFLVASMTGDDGDGTATDLETDTTEPPAETAPEEPETTEPPATDAPTTTVATTTTQAPTTTSPPAADSGGAGDTAVDYVRTLARGDFDAAWAMTTPRFQNNQSRSSWEGFWGGYDVDIVGEPRVSGGTVTVPLTFDGQREDYRLDLVQRGDGWLIDGPVGN
jgi:hypothetical protein